MTLKELRDIASALPLNVPDMRDDLSHHFAALNSYNGKLSGVLERLADSPGDASLTGDVSAYCGASMLVLVSIAILNGIDLEEAITAGEQALRGE